MIVEIKQLDVNDIEQMVCDSLNCPDDDERTRTRVTPLAQLLHKKTMGNPFFVQQLLISLHEDGLLTFDFYQVFIIFIISSITLSKTIEQNKF